MTIDWTKPLEFSDGTPIISAEPWHSRDNRGHMVWTETCPSPWPMYCNAPNSIGTVINEDGTILMFNDAELTVRNRASRLVRDEAITVKVTTPGGLILSLDPDRLPVDSVRNDIRDEVDATAAATLASLTGCAVTIERKKLTTSRPVQ